MPTADFYLGQGDTQSPIHDTLQDAEGDPVNLDGATVEFRMSPLARDIVTVHALASNDQNGDGSDGSKGKVSYAWQTGDTDDAGFYLARWIVTYSDLGIQSYPNDGYLLVVITEDPTVIADIKTYVTVEQVKNSIDARGTVFLDEDIRLVAAAASRAIDGVTNRRFWRDAANTNVRYFTPQTPRLAITDDIVEVVAVAVDRVGNGTYAEAWDVSDLLLEPLNAAADVKPYEHIRLRHASGRRFPTCQAGLKLTGRYGWPAVPDDVALATQILSAKYLIRAREAPFGIVTIGTEGQMMRIARTDPDVANLLTDYDRSQAFVT